MAEEAPTRGIEAAIKARHSVNRLHDLAKNGVGGRRATQLVNFANRLTGVGENWLRNINDKIASRQKSDPLSQAKPHEDRTVSPSRLPNKQLATQRTAAQ